jgi:hypothetical protein
MASEPAGWKAFGRGLHPDDGRLWIRSIILRAAVLMPGPLLCADVFHRTGGGPQGPPHFDHLSLYHPAGFSRLPLPGYGSSFARCPMAGEPGSG